MTSNRIDEIKADIEDLNDDITKLNKEKDGIENNEQEYVDQYDEYINQGRIKILGIEYTASTSLKEIDPIAYNCGYNDYFDEQLSELESDISDKKDEIAELQSELSEVEK